MQTEIKNRKLNELETDTASEKVSPSTRSWPELAQEAKGLLLQAESNQKNGDWAAYGQSLDRLSVVLEELERQARYEMGNVPKEMNDKTDGTEGSDTEKPE